MLKDTVVERLVSLKPLASVNQPRWIDSSSSKHAQLRNNSASSDEIINKNSSSGEYYSLDNSLPKNLESSDENVDAILRDVDKINLDRISQMSHEEIIQAQQEIMAMLPVSFKNVMNNKNFSKRVPPQPITEPLPALKSSQTGNTNMNPSPLERFDLSGCRVFADDKQAIVLLSTSITELLALSNIYIDSTTSLTTSNSLSPSKGATNDDALATALLDAATRAGFITICGDVEALSSVELFQHQYDPELPGYSMHEILELFRSDYSKQRILSSRILTGILRYRELIVSLPSYSSEYVDSENSRGICLDPLKMEELRIDSSYRKVIRQFRNLCMDYEAICATYVNRLRKSRDNEALSFQETRDFICRVCSKVLCASVLPPTLPSLLILDLKRATSGSASALQQQHLLQCLRSFLSSPVEEAHASLLWLGLWGQYGCPVLPMPHTIRPLTVSYEQHMRQCKMKKCSFLHMEEEPVGALDEAEEPTLSNSSPDPSDVFALQCRWGRIDAMFQACEEFDIFYSVILVPIMNSLSCVSRAVQGNSNSTGDHYTSGDEDLAILNGIAALEISVLVVKGGDSDLVKLFSQRILRKIAAPYTNVLKTMMIRDDAAGFELDRKVIAPMYHAAWCRLLAEWTRRFGQDTENDSKLFQEIVENESLWLYLAARVSAFFRRVGSIADELDLSKVTEHIAQQSQEVVWMLRLWRVCLGRGSLIAMGQATLLLGGQSPVISSVINDTTITNMHSDIWGHIAIARAEFFWLLEQLILSVSIQLHSISTLLSPMDIGLGNSEMLYHLFSLMVDLAIKLIQQEFQLSCSIYSSPSLNLQRASVFHFLGSILQTQKKRPFTEGHDHQSLSPIQMLVDSVIANITVRGGVSIHSNSSDGNSKLKEKWSELDAVLVASREVIVTQLVHYCSASRKSHDTENLTTLSWARDEMLTAAMRLLSILAVDTESVVVNVDACFLQATTGAGRGGPCVSQGLLLWQRHRLNQARVLIRLRYLSSMIDRSIQSDGATGTTSALYLKTLKSTLEDYLFAFTDRLLGYILFLYFDLIRVEANLAYPDLVNWSEFKSYLIGIVLKIKNVEEQAAQIDKQSHQHQFERFLLQDLSLLNGSRAASSSQYYPSSLLDCSHTTTGVSESIYYSYDEEISFLSPLQRSFLYRMLTNQGLSGRNLLLAVQLLLNIQKAESELSIQLTAQVIADK
eukprot:gene23171-30032_t